MTMSPIEIQSSLFQNLSMSICLPIKQHMAFNLKWQLTIKPSANPNAEKIANHGIVNSAGCLSMKIADPNAANPAAILNRDLSGIEDGFMNAPDMH